ncbi:MAG: hypothetical protein KF901_30090 [Myxococcales bacterium]|nr:hypothetical protein [Myxococcales bacterium]
MNERPRLLRDDRGAMMLLGIFMATIVIGMLYYVAGVGETITYRERMQDAVDSGAFAGSLLYARAMNVIVLLNMAIASVFAVAVAAYAAIFLIIGAALSAWSSCSIPWNIPACIAAACLTCSGIPSACDNADSKRDIARDVARNANNAANAIATATRIAAIGASAEIISMRYTPPVSIGAGIGAAMPLDDESPSRVCDEILTFSGPSGFFSLPPDSPYPATALIAYQEARRIANDCSAASYVDRAGGLATAFLWTYLSCYMIRGDVDNRTKKIRDGVRMGGNEFQFRTFAMAGEDHMPFEPNQERVELVTWGRTDSGGLGSIMGFLENANRFSVAQAEYYYDGDDDRGLWTWRLKWRSRLRRFRLTDGGGAGGCPPFMSGVCDQLQRLVIH